MKVSIIGGAGFIGSRLGCCLRDSQVDFEIIDTLVSGDFPEVSKKIDVMDKPGLKSAVTGDVVVLLAAIHRDDISDPNLYYRVNVDGARNVSDVCTELGIKKLIFTSSVAVYGFAKPGTDEAGDIKPFNHYGESKYRAEEVLQEWGHRSDNTVIIIRPTVVFGEENRGNVYNLFNQINKKRFLMIGSGKNKKSLAYVGNVAAFLKFCIETQTASEVYNYVDYPNLTMNELVSNINASLFGKRGVGVKVPVWFGIFAGMICDLLAKISKRPMPLSKIRVKKFVASTEFNSKAHSLEGFSAPFDLSQSIDNTLKHEFHRSDVEAEPLKKNSGV